jgi:ribosomal protein S18 acetylase RimI-like enzyme
MENQLSFFCVIVAIQCCIPTSIKRLLMECLELAKNQGLEKIELEVFDDNAFAIKLYWDTGFVDEGCRAMRRKIDGRYPHILLMGFVIAP